MKNYYPWYVRLAEDIRDGVGWIIAAAIATLIALAVGA